MFSPVTETSAQLDNEYNAFRIVAVIITFWRLLSNTVFKSIVNFSILSSRV